MSALDRRLDINTIEDYQKQLDMRLEAYRIYAENNQINLNDWHDYKTLTVKYEQLLLKKSIEEYSISNMIEAGEDKLFTRNQEEMNLMVKEQFEKMMNAYTQFAANEANKKIASEDATAYAPQWKLSDPAGGMSVDFNAVRLEDLPKHMQDYEESKKEYASNNAVMPMAPGEG